MFHLARTPYITNVNLDYIMKLTFLFNITEFVINSTFCAPPIGHQNSTRIMTQPFTVYWQPASQSKYCSLIADRQKLLDCRYLSLKYDPTGNRTPQLEFRTERSHHSTTWSETTTVKQKSSPNTLPSPPFPQPPGLPSQPFILTKHYRDWKISYVWKYCM